MCSLYISKLNIECKQTVLPKTSLASGQINRNVDVSISSAACSWFNMTMQIQSATSCRQVHRSDIQLRTASKLLSLVVLFARHRQNGRKIVFKDWNSISISLSASKIIIIGSFVRSFTAHMQTSLIFLARLANNRIDWLATSVEKQEEEKLLEPSRWTLSKHVFLHRANLYLVRS